MDDDGGDGSSLVLICPHCVLLAVSRDLSMDGVPPGEHWRRLSPTLDLPEGGPVGPHRLGAGLALVDARSNWNINLSANIPPGRATYGFCVCRGEVWSPERGLILLPC